MITILVIGLATAFNIIVILLKIRFNKYALALLDACLFILVISLTGSTLNGMAIGMIASLVISVYLLITMNSYKGT